MATAMTIDVASGAAVTSMDEILSNGVVMSCIMSKLKSAQDWYAASTVSRIWHDAVLQQVSKLELRSRLTLRHIVKRFKHIRTLDLSRVIEELKDEDLELCAESFPGVRSLSIGRDSHPTKIMKAGIMAMAAKFKFLEHLTLVNIDGLEESGLRAFGRGCPNLKSVAALDCNNLTDAAIDAICGFPALVKLDLSGSLRLVTGSGLGKIGLSCPNLLKLRLCDLSRGVLQALEAVAKGCPKLEEISLESKKINLVPLTGFKTLASLTVENSAYDPSDEDNGFDFGGFDGPTPLDDKVLPICKANKNLKELLLYELSGLSNTAVTQIMLRMKLEKLYLEGERLSSATIQSIARCSTLQDLTLEGISNEGLGAIGQRGPGLRCLTLRHCYTLDTAELESLISFNRKLERLDLSGCRSEALDDFSAIGQCNLLEFLDLSETNVSADSLVSISNGVQSLKELRLMACHRIRGMEPVLSFTSLESLSIEGCRFVSDHSLELLPSHCPRILTLDVGGTDVTDEGLVHLCRCELLRYLRTSFCQYVKGPWVGTRGQGLLIP